MRKRYKTNKNLYLISMILFIAFAFEFLIRGDKSLGIVMLFNGLINLLAYQQAPRRVASITVILNLFNALISTTVCYNYQAIDYSTLFFTWMIIALLYYFSIFRQIYSILSVERYKKKQKKRIS